MKHIWSLICEKSSIDSETNNISIFNCIEEIEIIVDKSKMPQKNILLIPISFQLLSLWDLNKEKNLELKIDILDPDNKTVHSLNPIFSINENFKRFRSKVNFEGMPISKNGRHTIRISRKLEPDLNKYKNEVEIPLDINIKYKV